MFSKCIQSIEKWINISVKNNNKLQKTTKHHEKIRKYKKEKLANMSRLVRVIIDNLERFRAQKSRLVLICRLAGECR